MIGSRLLSLLLLPVAATAGAQDGAPLEQSLTGYWASTDRQFVEFRADKTFRMYPKCGREADEWKQRGTPFLPATWEVADGNHLKLTVTLQEQSRTIDSTVVLAGDELRIVDGQGRTTVNRRYVGAWPPVCPINPLR